MNDILFLKQPPPGHVWESIELMSGGDFKIQVWLGKPAERTPPYPTIIHTHGGPESVMTNEFHASAQAWLDHGYAFLTINYRGSTTFGKDFKECIWGHPGTLEVEDILSARKWLINSGIAHPEQIFLTGYSYGGFLTLLAMGKTPGYWSGGMALAAVSDFVMSYEFQNPILKAYDQKIFHGSPEENPEAWKAASPITYAESFDAPILIIQGSNDSRTPAEPIRVFEKRLITLGKDIQVHWYEAGHIGPTKEQWIEFQQLMMDFADKILIK
jgi:dipeptidyl aminopeptidase/acylaminoacyl peptidase